MADLLLELFSEEIPARMQLGALSDLWKNLRDNLKKIGYSPDENPKHMFVTPRRLAVVMTLPSAQADVTTELKGPKVDAPQAAIDGFLKKSGMKLDQLEKQDGVYIAKSYQKGRPTDEILKPLIEDILKNFPWPKSMRWGANETSWVRPLHSILCIFDGKVVPVEFAGVKASNATKGHRFLAPKAITIKAAGDYETALEKAFVIVDRNKRESEIKKQADAIAVKHGLVVREDPYLLNEVTGLVEWPTVLMGTIDKNYMDLPKEVLVSEMRAHQKYFALETRDGAFSDKFLITSNMTATDGGKAIIAGNERVLRARLADGRFFWDQDRKKKLEDWAEGLKIVTFHAKLGSVADKVERVKKLALQLADYTKADKKLVERAAALSKADLVTGMVGEFPDLQGVMGRYYALAQKEPAEIADAIRDHYKPQGPSDSVPKTPTAICVALAEKLDTLISMFAIGEKPTGSKDPFALRRAALGIIRIVLENNIRLPLKKLANDELLAFFHDRLIVQLKDSGIRHDVIKAVIADGDDDLLRVVNRAKALQEFLSTDNGTNLLAGYKRAANIVAIEEKKDKASYNAAIDQKRLSEAPEIQLAKALETNRAKIESLFRDEKFAEMMKLLAELRSPVDQFFDKILVNCEDKDLRSNRLRLLSHIRASMDSVADFGKIEG